MSLLLLLFADGQKMIYRERYYALRNTTKLFGIKISPLNSKAMAYKCQVPMRSEILTENTIWEQVNKLTNLECEILGEKALTEIK
jgi:hypothetical protein